METLQNYLKDMRKYEGMSLEYAIKFMTARRATHKLNGLEEETKSDYGLKVLDALLTDHVDGNF